MHYQTLRSGPTVLVAVLFSFAGAIASAETVATVNDVDIDSTVLNVYMESRLQKPATQVTPEERSIVLDELKDIYLLTTQPAAKQVAQSDAVKAQAELQYRGLLAQATASDYLQKNPVTEEEILEQYETQIEEAPPTQYKARHILVESEQEADEVIAELDGGADFAALAKQHSTGPTGQNGGDLGWFSPEQMVKPFADAVAALEDGEITKSPVQTQFGWHVIQREGSRESQPPTLDSVRSSIRQRLEQERLQSYLQNLRDESAGS